MTLPAFPTVDHEELIRALRRGAVALTPNRRLARAYKHAFDRAQQEEGRLAWVSAEVLPWDTWLERSCVPAASGVGPALLTLLQEQAVWEEVVAASSAARRLIRPAGTAALAREAWKLGQDWQLLEALRHEPLNDDGLAFRGWSDTYAKRLHRLGAIDAAQLPRRMVEGLRRRELTTPGELVLCGFRDFAPAAREVLEALIQSGMRISELAGQKNVGRPSRVALPSVGDEIEAAARWARTRLEANPKARIGVVVDDLARIRDRVVRAFRGVLQPDSLVRETAQSLLPFNVSLGAPLASYPIARAALAAMELARGHASALMWSVLLRSPYLGNAESERDGRARLDARLRRIGEIELDVKTVEYYAQSDTHAPLLALRISSLRDFVGERKADRRAPSRWVETLFRILAALGFPGERQLASDQYQTWRRLKEILASLASLDGIVPASDLETVLARAQALLQETVFQPESAEVPIQVLGILEAAELRFDHLWVAGLTDENWPAAPHPNPLLPVALQRRAGVPHASTEQELRFANSLTQGFVQAAPEVVFSHAQREEDRDLAPSPLIVPFPAAPLEDLGIIRFPSLVRTVASANRLEQIADTRARALPAGTQRSGGTFVFRDEAACPFRAYANHRVGARSLEVPQPGLDPRARGSLMHEALAEVWRRLQTRSALDACDEAALGAVIEQAAASAVSTLVRRGRRSLSGRLAQLERRRLSQLVSEWLCHERARGEFEVELIEHKRAVVFGGLAVNAKLDRVDRLPDGRRIVIDYKGGSAKVADCLGMRPEEPQLPIYCVSSSDPVVAVAFGMVRVGEMSFRGLARDEDLLPGVRRFEDTKDALPFRDWNGLAAAWREELDRLGQAFLRGDAGVLPKRYPETCEHCGVQPFCRVSERIAVELPDNIGGESDE